MGQSEAFAIRIETEHASDGAEVIRAGLFCVALAAAIVAAGTIWLGVAGMFDLQSPDFFPLPDLFALASVALGGFFLLRGVVHQQRFRRFGTSVLDVTAPVLGETLRGYVRTSTDVPAEGPFTLRLRCDRQYYASTDTGDGSKEQTEHLWESVQTLPAATSSRLGIAVSFDLPATGLASGQRPRPRTGVNTGREYITWTLRVSAPVAGLDYVAEFPLDVAGLSGTPAGIDADAIADAVVEPATPFDGLARPEPDAVRWTRLAASAAGVLLTVIGVYAVWLQTSYGQRGDHLTGVVQTVERHQLLLALEGGTPARSYISSWRHWDVGQRVALVCVPDAATPRRCRADTGQDRWVDGLGTLAVGLVVLGAAAYLRRRRATP